MAKSASRDVGPRHRAGGPRIRRIIRGALIILLVAGPFLGTEMGLRALIAAGRLPIAIAHETSFDATWTDLHRERWDVLLMGDSTTRQGINPTIVRKLLSETVGTRVQVYDAGLQGARIDLLLAVARQLGADGSLPSVVVLGIQPEWFQRNAAFKDFFLKTPMGRIATDCKYQTGWDEIISCRMEQASVLWRMRGRLATVVKAMSRLARSGVSTKPPPDGFRMTKGATPDKLRRKLDDFVRKGQLEEFRIEPGVIADFTALFEYLKSQRVTVIPVAIPNIPPLAELYESTYPGWEAEYQGGLDKLERATHTRIARPRIDSWFSVVDAQNAKHLSSSGADKFTRQILSIDWVREMMVEAIRSESAASLSPSSF
jgi:hypothetical protein